MIRLIDFLRCIAANIARIFQYESCHDGSDGKSDCIGLIIGAVRLAGERWKGTHGSNWTARNAIDGLRKVSKASDLSLGEIVFKAHEPGESGYDADTINRSYKNSPDKRDYYHVGVVTSVQPFEITHCTGVSGGIKRDSTLGQWRWAGQLNLVNYNEGGDEPLEALYQAVTTANNSYPIRMRREASQNSAILESVPQGVKVDVLEETNASWDKVRYNGVVGYMMNKFLSVADVPDTDDGNIGEPATDTDVGRNPLSLENLTALKALLVPMVQEVEKAIQTLKGGAVG